MSLRDLAGGNLEEIEPAAETVERLLDGAIRHLQDSRIRAVSAETRFVSAYTAIRMLADVGLHAHGFRTRASVPGHHVVAIHALTATLGVDSKIVFRLDHLRKLRNAAEYSGDLIPESAVKECLAQGEALLTKTQNWLRKHKPGLLRADRG